MSAGAAMAAIGVDWFKAIFAFLEQGRGGTRGFAHLGRDVPSRALSALPLALKTSCPPRRRLRSSMPTQSWHGTELPANGTPETVALRSRIMIFL